MTSRVERGVVGAHTAHTKTAQTKIAHNNRRDSSPDVMQPTHYSPSPRSSAAASISPSPCAEDSLIVDFIDHCVQHGLQDELIARYVCIMVRAMRESIEAHAVLHANAHRDRLRRYEMREMWDELARRPASQPRTSLSPSVQSLRSAQLPLRSSNSYNERHSVPISVSTRSTTQGEERAKEVYTAEVHYQPRTPSPLSYSSKQRQAQHSSQQRRTSEKVKMKKEELVTTSTTIPAVDHTLPSSSATTGQEQPAVPRRRRVIRGTRTSQLRQRIARSNSSASHSEQQQPQRNRSSSTSAALRPAPVLSLAAQLEEAHKAATNRAVMSASPVHLSPPPPQLAVKGTTMQVDRKDKADDVLPSQALLRSFLESSRRTVREAERVLQATPVAIQKEDKSYSRPSLAHGDYGGLTEQELSPFLAISPSSSESK